MISKKTQNKNARRGYINVPNDLPGMRRLAKVCFSLVLLPWYPGQHVIAPLLQFIDFLAILLAGNF